MLSAYECDASQAVRLQGLFAMAFASGMRISDLVGLRLDAVVRDPAFLIIKGKGGVEQRHSLLHRHGRHPGTVHPLQIRRGKGSGQPDIANPGTPGQRGCRPTQLTALSSQRVQEGVPPRVVALPGATTRPRRRRPPPQISACTNATAHNRAGSKNHQSPGMNQVGKHLRNQPRDADIMEHVRMKRILPEEAYDKCRDKRKFRPFLSTPPEDDAQ